MSAAEERRVLLRAREEGSSIRKYPFAEDDAGVPFPSTKSDLVTISKDGSKSLFVSAEQAACVVDNATGEEISRFGTNVAHVAFSPLGTYALTWCRASLAPNENLCVWRTDTGERVAKFSQKDYIARKWPTIQWTDDESLACRGVSTEIHFFDGDALGGQIKFKVPVPRLESFGLSKGRSPYRLATFAFGAKGQPAKLSLVKIPEGTLIGSKSLFRADEARFSWSNSGAAVLATISTDSDATGKSYYGESNLFFMHATGEYDQRVELPKEGPTYDAQWAPRGEPQFIVVYGAQPARATLFNSKCEPIFNFGSGPWNCVYFSPHARFVAICGFQSLSGDVEVWDRINEQKVGVTKMTHTTSFSWSPCSRYMLSGTTYPRLRVDNGYRMFKYDGTLLEKKDVQGYLLQAEFLPASTGTFEDRPASPDAVKAAAEKTTSAGLGGKLADLSKVTGGEPYRPPGARNGGSAFITRDNSDSVAAGKVSSSNWRSKSAAVSVVPGAEEPTQGLTASQKKNKKRKEKKKQEQAEQVEPTPSQADTQEDPNVDTAETLQKKIRNLKKKHRRALDKQRQEEDKALAASIVEMEAEIAKMEKDLFILQT